MKKRLLALLLAVCTACAMLAVPASAGGANTAVQAAVMLGGVDGSQTAALNAPLTRGQLARLLTAFSPYRETAAAGGAAGTLFTDVAGADAMAPYIRTAVGQGWMSGYSDGSFRPGSPVTLEEGCAAVLNLLGYDVTTLSGTFPAAQLNKASEIGLRDGLACAPGQGMNLEDGAVLLFNALTAPTAEGEVYGGTLGFTVTDGQVDISTVLLGNLEGPFVAQAGSVVPFEPASVYRNGEVAASAELQPYDVYYYNQNARTLWVYSRKAAGRITAVAPSASAPASVTVAGTEYAIGTTAAASVISSLNGGGVGQVVTLLLGMDNEVVQVLTGEAADQVFYGVVQSSSRSLVEGNGADVRQSVTVACTDGASRTVSVDKSLNFPAGWLVEITVDENGEQARAIDPKPVGGAFNGTATALGDTPLADGVEILDTTKEGVAGTVSPSRLAGVALKDGDVRYYTTNAAGEIDRLILNNVTGDLWTYGLLDDVRNLTTAAAGAIDDEIGRTALTGTGTALPGGSATAAATDLSGAAAGVADIILPSTSDILYGIIDGSIASTLWDSLAGSSGRVASYALQLASKNTSGVLSNLLGWMGSGANYVCYIDGQNTTLSTSVKYPVLAGGIGVRHEVNGEVRGMVQLQPILIDSLGPASVTTANGTRYETADAMQVYLWHMGVYYPTLLPTINAEDYFLIGWVDSCTAGHQVRVLTALRKN